MIKGDKFLLDIYEYKILDYIPDNKELNDLGSNGWELCSILNLRQFNRIVYYFKRKNGELMTVIESDKEKKDTNNKT